MPDQPAGRLVFIGDYESIERLGAVEFARMVQHRYAAAPANPAEAVRIACLTSLDGYVSGQHVEQVASAVIRALGVPSEASS